MRVFFVLLAIALLGGCTRDVRPGPDIDAGLAGEIARIRAIDNHAHPVRMSANGEPPDREFDALPVDNMEPATDPWYLRPDAPGLTEASQALYGTAKTARAKLMAEKGAAYPNWVLDQLGVEVMLANRVVMGTGIASPRFRW